MGKWIDIKSTNLNRVSYYEDDLYVEFSSGAQYRYFNVPQDVFAAMLVSDSPGRFLNIEVKGKYTHELTKEADKKDPVSKQGADTQIPTVQETDGGVQAIVRRSGCKCKTPCGKRNIT